MAYLSQKISNSTKQTQAFGQKLGQIIPPGTILALIGDLGGGKTCFVQGLALGLAINSSILSPTFVISKVFPINKKGYRHLYHIDLYRLPKSQINQQALLEQINDKDSVTVIEWADRIKDWLPFSRTIIIKFNYLDTDKRQIEIIAPTKALDKLVKKAYN